MELFVGAFEMYNDELMAISIDCEMVEDFKGNSMLGRVSIVDQDMDVLLDVYVKPTAAIKRLRTRWSGIRSRDIENGCNFHDVQEQVKDILKEADVIIGHSIHHDYSALRLSNRFINMISQKTIDTSKYKPFVSRNGMRTPSLRWLARTYLDSIIQSGEHCSVEDAQTCMMLYLNEIMQ